MKSKFSELMIELKKKKKKTSEVSLFFNKTRLFKFPSLETGGMVWHAEPHGKTAGWSGGRSGRGNA